MISIVFAAVAISASPAVLQDRSDDPPIRVSLNSYYERGDNAKVRLRLAEDGYVVVLRVDADGRIRVLFPLDPSDDDFVRGGREFELRGRGGRETFYVDDRSGTGIVLAARSADPFHYDRFVRGDHWDYRALANDRVLDDPEAGLLDIVTEMADSGHFDYDVASYTIEQDGHRVYASSYYRHRPSYVGIYFGSRYRCGYYDPFWDPYGCDSYFYDPFYYDPFFYDPFYYRTYGYRSYGYRPFGYSCFGDPFCYSYGRHGYARRPSGGGGIVFKRPVPQPPFVLPRDRAPRNNPGAFDQPPIIAGENGRGIIQPRPRPQVGERRRTVSNDRGTRWTPQPAKRERPAEAAPRREARPRTEAAPRREARPRSEAAPRRETRPRSEAAPRRDPPPRTEAAPRRESRPRSEAAPRRDPPPRSEAAPRRDPPPRSQATPRSEGSTRTSSARPSNSTRRRP